MYSMVRKGLLGLSASTRAQGAILAFPLSRLVARRFVPGERLDQALAVVDTLNRAGMGATLDHLGENVTSPSDAAAAAEAYLAVLSGVSRKGLDSGVSVKPTHFGLRLGEDAAFTNIRRVVSTASLLNRFVRIDMEDSGYVDATLSIYRRLRREFNNVGVVLQTYLRRTADDVEALIEEGIADVRLVKGAYQEPASIAYQQRTRIVEAFKDALRRLWRPDARRQGSRAAVASHDSAVIDFARRLAREGQIAPSEFEFQFLYGVRTDVAGDLVAQGYRMRIYVPFGTRWYGYFMRRIAERPANLLFFLRALVGR